MSSVSHVVKDFGFFYKYVRVACTSWGRKSLLNINLCTWHPWFVLNSRKDYIYVMVVPVLANVKDKWICYYLHKTLNWQNVKFMCHNFYSQIQLSTIKLFTFLPPQVLKQSYNIITAFIFNLVPNILQTSY
jgi:hypothetical protein